MPKVMTNRRRFIQKSIGISAALPLLTGSIARANNIFSIGRSNQVRSPLILCNAATEPQL